MITMIANAAFLGRKKNIMNKRNTIYLILITFMLLSGCAGNKNKIPEVAEPSVVADENLDVSQLVGRRPATLAELVKFSASQQFSPLDSIYNRPPEGMSGNYFVQLSEQNEIVNLAQDVTTFLRENDVLAAGFRNGVIKIYGGGGCGAVQTASEPVNRISWYPDSKYLATSSGNDRVVELFRVDQCARVAVADVNSTVELFSLSPKGTWLALVDEGRRLWVGPAEGRLKMIYRFLHKPLSLSFSDGEGILMGVDVTGQLNMWSPLKMARIFEHKIKGGPFESVEAEGPVLNIVAEKGDKFTFDISKRVKTAYHESSDGFSLRNGVLSYRSPRKRLTKKVFLNLLC